MKIEVTVEAYVNPTESVVKVESAVKNVLGDIDLQHLDRGDETLLRGRLEGLDSILHFRDLLRRRRIRDTARSFFTRRIGGDVLSFGLNRQAAYAGHISFYRERESPLGPIQVTIRGDVEEIINYLCQK